MLRHPTPPGPNDPPEYPDVTASVTVYRVNVLEDRLTKVDDKVDDVQKRVIKVETAMGTLATKSQVYMLVAVTCGIAILSIVAHVGLRLLASSPTP